MERSENTQLYTIWLRDTERKQRFTEKINKVLMTVEQEILQNNEIEINRRKKTVQKQR